MRQWGDVVALAVGHIDEVAGDFCAEFRFVFDEKRWANFVQLAGGL